jgi:hypothetical protein
MAARQQALRLAARALEQRLNADTITYSQVRQRRFCLPLLFAPPFRKSGQIGKRIREKAHLLGLRSDAAFAPTKRGPSKKRLETEIGRQ